MSTMRAVYTNIRAARTAIKDMARLRQIATVLVRHGFHQLVAAWNLQDKAILGLLLEKRDEDLPVQTLFGRIVAALEDLGPTFVKLGQILSTRSDLIPQALCDELKSLQDSVGPITQEEARQCIEASLGCPIEEVFDDFDPAPLACASIAQVHTAFLKSGEKVVIKVQRPGINEKIVSDLSILHFVARQLEATIPEAAAFDPVSIAQEFERAIIKELDFNYEANNLQRFARNFEEWPTVYIPTVYKEHSSVTVLVMEFLQAQKITDAAATGAHDMEPIARECVRMLFKQVFEDGFFHGDLHPGNLLILEDGRIGLIDFGLIGRMTGAMKDQMADLLLCIVMANYEGVARSFYDLCIKTTRVDYPAFEGDVIELMERYFDNASLAEVDFGALLKDLIDGAIRHNVRIPPDFTMFFKAIMTVEGIGKIVSPDLDLVSECRPYVEKLVAARYSPERVFKNLVDVLQSFVRLGKQFPLTATEFLTQVQDGKITLRIEDQHVQMLEEGRERRANRGIAAACAGVLFLCGTWLTASSSAGVPILAIVFYALGGLLGTRLAWRMLRSPW